MRPFCSLRLLLMISIVSACQAADSGGYVNLPDAPQLMYQHGVPHSDSQGRLQSALGTSSFFPRCIYETLPGMLVALRDAGFNCFKPWNGLALADVLPEAGTAGMQLIKQMQVQPCEAASRTHCGAADNAGVQIERYRQLVAPAAANAQVLGWYIEEEPTACINTPASCPERLRNFQGLRNALRGIDPVHPSFALDISLPKRSALEPWNAFNSNGDVAAIDNYPFHKGSERSLEDSAGNYRQLTRLNHEAKPLWVTLQAFGMPPSDGGAWVFPTPRQLRAEVFTALIHGATGVIYFALDSPVVRSSHVIGISATTPASYPGQRAQDAVASPENAAASRALWSEALQLNAELARLQSVLLSPTATMPYAVAVSGRRVSETPIRTLLKRSAEGHCTLLVVNIDAVPLKARFSFSRELKDLVEMDSAGRTHSLDLTALKMDADIDGFGVKLYSFE
jgi:hypothetical protein